MQSELRAWYESAFKGKNEEKAIFDHDILCF